jgi:hypothetical protein
MAPKPLFVFSLPRSGSTLLQRILAYHPDIATVSETWILLPLAYTLKSSGIFAEYNPLSQFRALEALYGELPGGKKDYHKAIKAFADTIYAKLSGNESRYFLDKTPRYYLILDEIADIFEDSKMIFLFRHPLAVLSSMIQSFNGGRLGDYRHHIDAVEGPHLLAAGYRKYGNSAIAVQYEDMVSRPDDTIQRLCSYLEIEYVPSMVADFNRVQLGGVMGDAIGSRQYNKVETGSHEKWKTVFGTVYRRNYARRYINALGRSTIKTLGYSLDGIRDEIDTIQPVAKGAFKDMAYQFWGKLMSFSDMPALIKKESDLKKDGLKTRNVHYYK